MGQPALAHVELTTVTCITCGCTHAIPETMRAHMQKEGGYYHCPAGHSQGWDKGQRQKELDDLRRAAQDADRRRNEALARANEATVRADKAEAETKRIKTRVHNGTCPCCKRTFANLAKHMKSKHPDVK